MAAGGLVLALAGCSAQPMRTASNGRIWDPALGVWSSPKLVADGEAVPKGGGAYLTGRPYVIGGRTYVPRQDASGYSVVGIASWYGDAFHGRRTANGEIFDKRSISAAHPTLPLPSYVRVTNLKNGRSMVVRVNDRGPYHGGRVMDVSQRVAESLDFRGEGTARIRVDYVGRAPLGGSDDERLIATLRTDGGPAQLQGLPGAAQTMVAQAPGPVSQPVAEANESIFEIAPGPFVPRQAEASVLVPVPPPRPFSLDEPSPAPGPLRRRAPYRSHVAEAGGIE
jgi:rare lipoprotein A